MENSLQNSQQKRYITFNLMKTTALSYQLQCDYGYLTYLEIKHE